MYGSNWVTTLSSTPRGDDVRSLLRHEAAVGGSRRRRADDLGTGQPGGDDVEHGLQRGGGIGVPAGQRTLADRGADELGEQLTGAGEWQVLAGEQVGGQGPHPRAVLGRGCGPW